MAIQFILGASGTGKTSYIYEKLIQDSMKEEKESILFVLPEQSNMATEQDMVSRHPMGGTMDVSILSFTRLAFKVFDELNVHTYDVLDDYGKSMLLMKVLKEQEGKLVYYKNMIGKPGFVDEVKSLLSEFYQYQITESLLETTISSLSPDKSLYYKLTDLKRLLHAFNEAMHHSYMVTEQLLTLLKEVAQESKLLQEAVIYFDGFTGFTPVQYEVIEELMKVCKNLYFSFTMDESIFGENGYSEQGLFAMGKQAIDRLCKLAERNQVFVYPHIGLTKNYRLQENAALQHLERQIFRFPAVQYEEETENLLLVNSLDSREEAMYIAQFIKESVMEKGYRYRDFAVIVGDVEQQAMTWESVMHMLDIPYFIDNTERLSHNPIAEFLGCAMNVFRRDFSYESVFSLLKTGFLDVDKEGVYELENYALKYGVKGYSWWNQTFLGNQKGLHAINETRNIFMETLSTLCGVFVKKQGKVREYLYALYDFMSTNGLADKISGRCALLEQKGDVRGAKAYRQAYEKLILVLDKTMDILGEEDIVRDDLIDVLLSGISDVRLGVIPSTLDQVVIGDMERTRMHNPKIVFLAGANEGILPKSSSKNGILGDKDRRQLKDMQISLAPDSKEELFQQQFYLYLQMAQASVQLVISYRQSDEKGAELRPSYFVKRIEHIFPDLKKIQASAYMAQILPSGKESLLAAFARQLEREEWEDSSVCRVLQEEEPEQVAQILKGYFYNNESGVLNRAIAKELYGECMLHSVSRLETYAGCAYKFFLQYGLKLAKREEYQVESNNIGTILHAVMERFFGRLQDGECSIDTITKEQLDRFARELTVEAAREENETIFDSSARNRHQLEVLIRVAKRSMKNLCRHLHQGNMKPAFFEKRFSPEDKLSYIDMALSAGMRMELNGIVDRVDVREKENTVYVKIIDYKSGAKDIDYVKVYEGKQLQLTVYMSVMLELLQRQYPDKKIVPTGMYYYHICDPIVEEAEEERMEQQRIKESRLSGLVNADTTCLDLMDGGTGTVVPVNYKTDGSLGARNSSLVSTEELLQMSQYVRDKMIAIGDEITDGAIAMNPEKGERNSPCNYCDYKSVCRFEPGLGGNAYRIGTQITSEEAKAKILNQKQEEGEAI